MSLYGDESWEATGAITAKGIVGGVHNSRNRVGKHVLIWDEPDLGLSDSYCAGAGEYIRDFMEDPPEKLQFAMVIAHSRYLVNPLVSLKPHHIHFGPKNTNLGEWLERDIDPLPIEELKKIGIERFRKVCSAMKGD